MAPVWLKIPEEYRGQFAVIASLADYARTKGIKPTVYRDKQDMWDRLVLQERRLTVVCGHQDPKFTDSLNRPNVIMMHGVGFIFDEDRSHPSYPGTQQNRKLTRLMLSTNKRIAKIEREANPHIRVEVVGCPKLDWYHRKPGKYRYKPTEHPTIALAWHWDCKVADATGTAFYEYERTLGRLRNHYKLLGHGHPHIIDKLIPRYEELGIEVVRDLSQVFERADMMVCDASSAMFEFAAIGKPVVVADSPIYQGVDYGGMFYLRTQLGMVSKAPNYLMDAVTKAIPDPKQVRERRKAAVKQCYTYTDGYCAQRAAKAILEVLE